MRRHAPPPFADRAEAGALLAEARSLDAQLAMAGYAATGGGGAGY